MFHTQLLRISQVCLFACVCVPVLAATYSIQGNTYVPGSVTENVTVSFTTPTGGKTVNNYSGYVMLTVSGTGTSNAGALNDAFYLIGPPQTYDLNYFQLAVDSADLTPKEPTADAVTSIAFDVDANKEVRSQPYLPLYRANNTYTIIIDTTLLISHGSVPAALRFGVSDATFTDNSGNYSITVTQLIAQNAATITQSYVISTIAGNGTDGFTADGTVATQSALNSPGSVALDSQGRLYISDGGNNRVRMIQSNGTIMTVAGTTSAGLPVDGVPATSGYLYSPSGITFDSSGNLYIADTLNGVIRKVSNGTINTVAGSNSLGPGLSTGDGGPATSAQLLAPAGVALDSFGNLYIADQGNSAIRVVTNGNISTLGTSDPSPLKLKTPAGVAVDASGNLFIADKGNHRIVERTAAGVWSVVAGTGASGFSGDNGPATKAMLSFPAAVAVDAAGQIYIADTLNSRVRLVTTAGIITTIAGTGRPSYSGDGGPATNAALYDPPGVAVDTAGNVYVADANNERVRLLQVVPTVFSGGVVNAASFAAEISPGALATVFGSGLAAATTSAAALPLTNKLGGVSVNVNNQAAPVLFVSPGQVNFQVPFEASVGTASVTVSANGLTSSAVNVPVMTAAPGLFFDSSGHAIVQNQDSSLNSPANPAKVGSTVVAYLTGSGPLDHSVGDGAATPASPLSSATSTTAATFGTTPGQVSFAGLTPGFVGLLQMNVVVPSTLTTQDYLLTLSIAGQKSNAATVSVSK
jgi:uncharacterized protein (TIGR03437 family)